MASYPETINLLDLILLSPDVTWNVEHPNLYLEDHMAAIWNQERLEELEDYRYASYYGDDNGRYWEE
jgi:hypothetical protein